MRGIMTEIIKEGHYEKHVLYFWCDRCDTKFKTDEWLFMHEPITEGKPKSGNGYVHATCPLCKHFITVRAHGS